MLVCHSAKPSLNQYWIIDYPHWGDSRQTWSVSWLLISRLWCYQVISSILTHWGRVMRICFSKLTNIGSDNGFMLTRQQAIIWTNDGILLIWPSGTNFSEILFKIHIFSSKKTHLKVLSAKCRPFCLSLSVLSTHVCEMSMMLPWLKVNYNNLWDLI